MCDVVHIVTTAFEKENKVFEMRIETMLINYADSNASCTYIRTCLVASVVGWPSCDSNGRAGELPATVDNFRKRAFRLPLGILSNKIKSFILLSLLFIINLLHGAVSWRD